MRGEVHSREGEGATEVPGVSLVRVLREHVVEVGDEVEFLAGDNLRRDRVEHLLREGAQHHLEAGQVELELSSQTLDRLPQQDGESATSAAVHLQDLARVQGEFRSGRLRAVHSDAETA